MGDFQLEAIRRQLAIRPLFQVLAINEEINESLHPPVSLHLHHHRMRTTRRRFSQSAFHLKSSI